MMTQGIYEILYNFQIAPNVYSMVLAGDTSSLLAPGQFVNIKLEGKYLRRPISVCDYNEETITLIYKVVGEGTEQMSKMKAGEKLDMLVGLGNGFNPEKAGDKPLLIGGGVGIPPMYNLCKELLKMGKTPTVILGFNTKEEIFYEDAFKNLGVEVIVTTVDGSYGVKGYVTDAMDIDYTYFFTCGPMPMFRAIESKANTSGQYSFEERMGCGFGACMGCSCKTITGNKRICKEGPVLVKEDIIWED